MEEETMSKLPVKRVHRAIEADSIHLALAMWMEMFPDDTEEQCSTANGREQSTTAGTGTSATTQLFRKVGCVLVEGNGRLLAIDRSRDGVHGLASLLVKHHDRAKDCSVFISRKPCTYCSKLSLKAGVRKVSYPPVEPEYYEARKEEKRVEALFDAAQIVQNVFFPQLKKELVTAVEEELSAKATSFNYVREFVEKVSNRFWNDKYAKGVIEGPFHQAKHDLENLSKWFAQIYLPLKHSKFALAAKHIAIPSERATSAFDPENDLHQRRIANHLLALGRMTVQYTVEPKTGVGCVIMKDNDIVAVGWNDFPLKSIEESFHYATDQERDGKYPFFIHAEQNALLARNAKDVTGTVIFVTKIPCHECTPLVKVAGIGTVVLSTPLKPVQEKYSLNYDTFREEVERGTFICYETSTENVS